ncbi:MAG TPA: tripartite tricarboxylate transporter substrate binding protein [Burkholderiales bacterium]|nr:tripartite tricarboxylate transporter substrate binding protein [Burkholderiales bacterium]
MIPLARSIAALLAFALLGSPQQAGAQQYPSKPIRIVCALAPGGGVDTTSRLIGQKLTDAWGQPVVVENRPGAGGTIAAEIVAHSAPDGYTLLMDSSGHAIAPSVYKLSYDAIKSFAPISLEVYAPSVLVVHPSLPVHSVKELLAFARERPDQLLFSSAGNGSPQHLALELLKLMTGVKIVHVPYKGTAPSMTDLIGGRVSASAASTVSTMPHVRAGRLRALAVISGKRSLGVPELPTVAEAGVPGYAVDTWYGLFAPAGTPKEVVAQIYQESAKALALPEIKDKLLASGLEPVGSPPGEFTPYVRAEVEKWGKVIRQAGVKIN